jgi:hypothetical protein
MTAIDHKIRTQFPILLGAVYESAELEQNIQIKTQIWIDFFEETMRYLSLIGLAFYRRDRLENANVEEVRKSLTRPSLGHWVRLFQSLENILSQNGIQSLSPPLKQKQSGNPIADCVSQIKRLMDNSPPNTIRTLHLMDTLVEFRNKKIGHGSLTAKQAEKALGVIRPALLHWLDQVPVLTDCYLLYIDRVEWQDPHFVLRGTRNQGTSLYHAQIEQSEKATGDRVYLAEDQSDAPPELLSLYPFVAFDNSDKIFYVYSELSSDRHPKLRCTYKPSEAHRAIELDVPAAAVLSGQKVDESVDEEDQKSPDQPESADEDVPLSDLQEKEILMTSWFDIITPHADIQEGRLDESIFAADLGDVVSGSAPDDYKDAYLFFQKTYLTQGIKNLLRRVHQTLVEGTGSSVVQIQTPFGGGKTHSLVAVYHYLKNGEKVKSLLPSDVPTLDAHVTAISGNHWDVVDGMTSEGITRKTLWGEMAFQLGGKTGYEVFRQTDEERIAPGKDKLRRFLEANQPFVLLFDEILEYINRALDKRLDLREEGVSLGTQTFSFFQELTEAIATIPNGMMIVTLPSSQLEDYSDQTEGSLARLNKIFGRVESIETPVHGEEVYEVIRRRLFQVETMKVAEMRTVVHQYFQTYKNNRDELPNHVRDMEYRDKMEKAYPFHPSVIDLLYEKWSTFATFQRTRGVLRLLANVVEELYQREAPLDMILPGDINLDHPSIRQEFLKHIGQEYEGVVGSDIAGHEAKSQTLDRENREWKHLAQRISTAIFYHSFSGDDSEKGTLLPYIKLATIRHDTIPAMVTEVLTRLSHILWYLNSRGDNYYFSDIPNLNRMIMDKKELFNDSYEMKLEEVIESEIQNHFRTYLWPSNGDGIPDNRDLKLVVLHPNDSGDQIPNWLEHKGETFREYKNTLFFALPDLNAFVTLREEVKKLLALQEIKDEIRRGDSQLPDEKRTEVDRQMHAIQRDFSFNVRRMYHRLHLGDRTVDLGNPTTGRESLSHWFWHELTSDNIGAILTRLHYRVLVNKFLRDNDQISTLVLLDQFYKDVALPAPESPGVVARAIKLGIKDGAFGLIEVIDGEKQIESLKFQTNVPLDAIAFDQDTLLLSKDRAEAIAAKLVSEGEDVIGVGGGQIDLPGEPLPSEPSETGPVDEPTEITHRRVRLVVSGVPASKIADVNRGILLPFTRSVGDFTFTLEIDIESEDGISESVLTNQVKETIKQIGGKIEEEEIE